MSALLLIACQDSPYSITYRTVDACGWQSRDTLTYHLPQVPDTMSRTVQMTVTVRTVQNYHYDNLALLVRLYEDRHIQSTDTIKYQIYDKQGENTGTGFPYVEHQAHFDHPITLKSHKKYRVKITHIMRLDPLDGISDVGIELH